MKWFKVGEVSISSSLDMCLRWAKFFRLFSLSTYFYYYHGFHSTFDAICGSHDTI